MKTGEIFNPYHIFTGIFIPIQMVAYPGLSPAAKIVWGRLAFYAGRTGIAWPKQETLAEETGLDPSYCRRILLELEKEKFIVCERAKGVDRLAHRSNRYRFLWHEIFNATVTGDSPERDYSPVRECAESRSIEKESLLQKNQENLKPSSSEHSFRLAELLFNLIISRKPDFKKPNLQSWTKDIDRMLRLDRRPPDRIEAVIRWVQQDPFWQANILSPRTLREKFDQLELKMNHPAQKPSGLRTQRPGDRCDDLSKYDSIVEEVLPDYAAK